MVITRGVGKSILYGGLILLLIQGARALVYRGLILILPWLAQRPLAARALVFSIMAAGFCLAARPSPAALGLVPARRKSGRRLGWLTGILWLMAVGSSAYFGPGILLENLIDAGLIPLTEECLFRGFLWGAIEEAWPGSAEEGGERAGTWAALITTTILFGLWHLGYADMVVDNLGGRAALPAVMGTKVLIGLCVGLLAGAGRALSGSAWPAIFLHGLWNVFGR